MSFLGPLLIVLYFFFSLALLGILFHSYLTIFHNLNSKFFEPRFARHIIFQLIVFIHCMVYPCLSCLVTSFISCNMKINAVLFSVYFKILISILKILTDIFRLKQCVTSHRIDLFFTTHVIKFFSLTSLGNPQVIQLKHNFFMKIKK